MLIIQFALQLLLPAVLIYELYRKKAASKLAWFLEVCILGLLILFIFYTARWDTLTYYLRIVIPLIYLATCFVSYRNIEDLASKPAFNWLRYSVQSLVVVLLLALNLSVLKGYFYPDQAVTLSYPLKGGVYYVGGGGNSRWINNHNAFPPQTYAIDIVRLNGLGNRAFGLAPKDLERYTIFGDTLYSPCKGEVIIAIDALPDQIPPSKGTLAGNHIVISCMGVDVLLAHLMKGSVTVNVGDTIVQGQAIAKVGNSGNTSQPHLHIHVEKGGAASRILDGEGVPIKFENRFLLRNDLFRGN